jgi:hypothetical protein
VLQDSILYDYDDFEPTLFTVFPSFVKMFPKASLLLSNCSAAIKGVSIPKRIKHGGPTWTRILHHAAAALESGKILQLFTKGKHVILKIPMSNSAPFKLM